MPTINRAIKYRGKLHHLNIAAVVGVIVISFSASVNAQSRTADSFNFDSISVGGKSNWNFSSEDETVSIRNTTSNRRFIQIIFERLSCHLLLNLYSRAFSLFHLMRIFCINFFTSNLF